MKSRTLKSARAAALASMLFAQGPLVVSGRAAPAPSSDGFGAFIDKFWPETWGTPFQPDQSGLLLGEIAPGVFGIQVIAGERVVATGTYFEVLRLDEPQLGGWPELGGVSDQLHIDHAVTAGIIVGATGAISPVFGLDVRVEYLVADAWIVTEGLTPLGLAADAASAVQSAYELHAQLSESDPVLAGGDPPLTEGSCRCGEQYANDRAACKWRHIGCQASCAGALALALVGCSFRGPLAPPCIAAAVTAYVACMTACLTNRAACLREAANKNIECLERCAAKDEAQSSPWRR